MESILVIFAEILKGKANSGTDASSGNGSKKS